MGERILLIDDDPNLLSALQRQLRKQFELATAEGGQAGVDAARQAVEAGDPFAVALSDMRMPGMDGIETLKRVREVSPDTVRMMLTGNADQQTAIDAINQGNIFRFYTKPCPAETLATGLGAAIDQYRLVTAERDLLEKTLAGSIKVLVDVVSINDPAAYALSTRLREWVRGVTAELKLPLRWQLDIAAMLVPLGQVAIPPELVAKQREGHALTEAEQSLFDRAPEAARNLIANIPRLSKVAEIVYLHDRGYDGSGFPPEGPAGADIPADSRLLKILKDLALATKGGPPTAHAFAQLDKVKAKYDPVLLRKVRNCLEAQESAEPPPTEVDVPLAALRAGYVVLTDIRLANDHLILAAGTRLSEAQVERLRNLRRIFTMTETVRVRV